MQEPPGGRCAPAALATVSSALEPVMYVMRWCCARTASGCTSMETIRPLPIMSIICAMRRSAAGVSASLDNEVRLNLEQNLLIDPKIGWSLKDGKAHPASLLPDAVIARSNSFVIVELVKAVCDFTLVR
jgi:hypothetical protein